MYIVFPQSYHSNKTLSGVHLYLTCGEVTDLRGGDLGAGGVHDEEEPVHRDQHDRECGEEDAAGLGGADQLAEVLHVLAQSPILATTGVQFCVQFYIQTFQFNSLQQECNISR